jgi:hypothetical protein
MLSSGDLVFKKLRGFVPDHNEKNEDGGHEVGDVGQTHVTEAWYQLQRNAWS